VQARGRARAQVAAFIESAAGIREGGRTGLTALTAAWWFFVSLFFTPILCARPPAPAGPPCGAGPC
jgi:AGZA family xanthine/uracil permease-like MFS transporter